MEQSEPIVKRFYNALISIDRDTIFKMIFQSRESGFSILSIFDNVIVPAMEQVGRDWENDLISLSQVYMSGKICEEIAVKFGGASSENDNPEICLCVLNDYHTLGKKIISMFLTSAGYSVMDLGRVSTGELIEKLKNGTYPVCFISVLMLPSAYAVADVKTGLLKEKIDTKLVVGGAPFRLNHKLWKEVGADDFGKTAGDALSLAARYVSVERNL